MLSRPGKTISEEMRRAILPAMASASASRRAVTAEGRLADSTKPAGRGLDVMAKLATSHKKP